MDATKLKARQSSNNLLNIGIFEGMEAVELTMQNVLRRGPLFARAVAVRMAVISPATSCRATAVNTNLLPDSAG
jgi:hypothetical protein